MVVTRKYLEVPIALDDNVVSVNVSKSNTCKDVLLRLQGSPTNDAIFAVVDGVENELPAKSKLLKIWRNKKNGKKVEFVVRRSNDRKGRQGVTKKDKRKGEKGLAATAPAKMRDRLKKVSDLAFYVRYQKTKLNAMINKQNVRPEVRGDDDSSALMQRIIANVSTDSMDAFLAQTDPDQMAQFLSFCQGVTVQHLQGRGRKSPADTDDKSSDKSKSRSDLVRESLGSTKLGLRQQPQRSSRDKTSTSTGTLSSQDTGYSTSSRSTGPHRAANSHSHNSPDDETTERWPRYSTPMAGHSVRRSTSHMETTFNAEEFNEAMGKDVILQKFMADQTMAATPGVSRRTRWRQGLPSGSFFRAKERRNSAARYRANDITISGGDMFDDDNASLFDRAFLGDVTAAGFGELENKKTLRRESAISNLNKVFAVAKPEVDDIQESFDYSFDCSFQSMLEPQSMNFTYSCDDSSEDCLSDKRQDAEFMCSFDVFERTKRQSGYLSGSDEGLGSLSSDSETGFRTELS